MPKSLECKETLWKRSDTPHRAFASMVIRQLQAKRTHAPWNFCRNLYRRRQCAKAAFPVRISFQMYLLCLAIASMSPAALLTALIKQ